MDNLLDAFNDKAAQDSFEGSDIQSYKVHAVLPYLLPILFFLPLIGNKNSAFCKFHANQQLAWLITGVVIGIVCKIISLIPILGAIISIVVGIALLAAAILLMISAANGKAIKIPVVGEFIKFF